MAGDPLASCQLRRAGEALLSRSLNRVIVARRMRPRLASNAKMDEIDVVAVGSRTKKNTKAV